MAMQAKETKGGKVQRIKMKIYGQPVKHDGTITSFDPETGRFTVTFDGPLDDITFEPYSKSKSDSTLVIDVRAVSAKGERALRDGELWEVI